MRLMALFSMSFMFIGIYFTPYAQSLECKTTKGGGIDECQGTAQNEVLGAGQQGGGLITVCENNTIAVCESPFTDSVPGGAKCCDYVPDQTKARQFILRARDNQEIQFHVDDPPFPKDLVMEGVKGERPGRVLIFDTIIHGALHIDADVFIVHQPIQARDGVFTQVHEIVPCTGFPCP